MLEMMSKLLKQQTAPDVDIYIFSGDPVDYHYFIAVFEEVVEKKIDDCIQQPVPVGYKNARSLLEEKYENLHYIVAAY